MDAKEVFELIKVEYSEDIVNTRFDEELCEWVDEGWEDDFETEHDAYQEQGRGEAENVVIEEMIDWYERAHEKLGVNIHFEIFNLIKEHYDCLNNSLL